MSHALPSLCAHHYCPLAQIYTGMLNYQTAYVLPISVSKRHVPLMHSQYPVLHVAHHHLNSWLAICAVHPDTNTLQPLICGLAYQSPISTQACVCESLTATLGRRRRELTHMRHIHMREASSICRADIGPSAASVIFSNQRSKPVILAAFRMREST